MKPYRPLARVAVVTQVLLASHAVLNLVALGIDDSTFQGLSDDASLGHVMGTLVGLVGLISLIGVVLLGTVVAFLIWLNRAAHNARVLYPGAFFSITPGWAVTWWFVPIAFLYKPYRAVQELWDAARPGGAALVGVWWCAFVMRAILSRFTMNAAAGSGFEVAYAAVNAVAAVLCIAVVRAISAAQAEAWVQQKRESIGDVVAHVPQG